MPCAVAWLLQFDRDDTLSKLPGIARASGSRQPPKSPIIWRVPGPKGYRPGIVMLLKTL